MGILNPNSDFQGAGEADNLDLQLLRVERRLQRERTARLESEAIAERGLRALYVSQQRLALLQRVAAAANESTSVEATLRFAVEEICQHTGWALGQVYVCPNDKSDSLVSSDIWFASDPNGLFPFVEISRSFCFRSGVGLPGRVLADGSAQWVTDVTLDANFPRAPTALACGLHSGFAFPVMVGSDVAAVIEFFARETLNPNDELLSIMTQIGIQLGRVIERKRAEDRLIHDALHDPLTGLPNRALFVDRLTTALQRGLRNPDLRYATIFIDLDGFKLVNDSLGHIVGDELLVDVARRLRETLAECERNAAAMNANWRGTLARMGGDEFAVLLDDLEDESVAPEVAARLHQCLKRSHSTKHQNVYSTASIGIAFGRPDYTDVYEIMRDADLAMYEAKSTGRDRTAIFDQKLRIRSRKRLEIESDLRRATQRGEFVLYYQPIIALADHRLEGFEALLRWRRGGGDLLEPGEFIQVAEETGLIVFMGDWVLREACATLAQWHRTLCSNSLTMSINISPRQFLERNFARNVRKILLDCNVDPNAIHLEITEGAAIKEPERTRQVVQQLKSWGIRISLDDFGTGYSSLSYLHSFPFDTIKIDRSFVSRLGEAEDSRGIIQAVMDLARNLSMDVVAEGLETEGHAAILDTMGCQFGQGFLFGRPMDREAAERFMRSGRASEKNP
jgi:diguanylate cyclase (GGDEF)-like protein